MSGGSIVSNTREFGTFGNDGAGFRTSARAYDSKGRVSYSWKLGRISCLYEALISVNVTLMMNEMYVVWDSECWTKLNNVCACFNSCSRGCEKYFRRSRLNWPEGAVSRESIRAVKKLDSLKVFHLYHYYPTVFSTWTFTCDDVIWETLFYIIYASICDFEFLRDYWIMVNIYFMQNMLSQYLGCSRSSFIDLLHDLLRFDPSERLTAREALEHPFFRIPGWRNQSELWFSRVMFMGFFQVAGLDMGFLPHM